MIYNTKAFFLSYLSLISAYRPDNVALFSDGNLHRIQTTILGWLGLTTTDSKLSHHTSTMSGPPRTRQASARQPHGVGTFLSNTVTDADNTTATTSSARRSRRIAGEVADLESWPPEGTPDQRTRRSSNRSGNQQEYPAPPSSVFTFARPEPSVPSPGFSLPQTTGVASMNLHQNNEQGRRSPGQPSPGRTRGGTPRTNTTLPNGMPAVVMPLALTQPVSRSTTALDHASTRIPVWAEAAIPSSAWQVPPAVSRLSTTTSTLPPWSPPPQTSNHTGHAQLAGPATMGETASAASANRDPFFTQEPFTMVDRSGPRRAAQHQARVAPPSNINLDNPLDFPALPLPRRGADFTAQLPSGNTVARDPWSIASGADRYPNDPPTVNPFAVPLPPVPQPPRKICIICCDADQPLVQPCLHCSNFYCRSCIKDMFEGALKDMSMMPAHCCSIIQLSIALPQLTQQQADTYRARFEEWLTPTRTYCPVPTCSTFISERFLIPASKPIQTFWEVLEPRLRPIIKVLISSPHSKYFRSIRSPSEHELSDFHHKVKKPIFMDAIERKARHHAYATFKHFMADMNLLLDNSALFRRTSHNSVGTAGERLRDLLYSELGNMKIDIEAEAAKRPHNNTCFACPKCFMGICAECKQVAHPLKPCDTTSRDHEAAMIATFGYKQCPKCGHAVKRMFGCRHMQCQCGAHWCWSCQKPIDECEVSGCGGDEESDFEDEDGYDSPIDDDEDEIAARRDPPPVVVPQAIAPLPAQHTTDTQPADEIDWDDDEPDTTAHAGNSAAEVVSTSDNRVDPPASRSIAEDVAIWDSLPAATPDNIAAHVHVARRITEQIHGVAIQSTAVERPVDLDAGGGRRWHDTDLNFGEEPDEPMSTDLAWSCRHQFMGHRIQATKVENGYPLELECNRCFSRVHAEKLEPKTNESKLKSDADKAQKKRGRHEEIVAQQKAKSKDEKKVDPAFSCEICTLVVCESCKAYYIKEKGAEDFY